MNPLLKATALGAVMVVLVSCGGDGPTPTLRFPASSTLAGRCAIPRTGLDPITGATYRDRQGTLADEKAWERSWMDELYLWYREVPDVSATDYATTSSYFHALLTPALSPSGKPKDQFSFTFPTAGWEALAQSGVEVGYGVQWVILAHTVPRKVVAAYNQPGSPAALQNVGRGVEVLSVDGADVVNGAAPGEVEIINAGLFPAVAGETHTFVLQDVAGTTFSATLTAGSIASAPVQNVHPLDPGDGHGPVGYILFNDHVATAEAALVGAVSTLAASGITDLVLDLRYNGGGYLDIASELAFMIAGPGPTAGRTFELTAFNDKYPTKDPVTGLPIVPMGFESTTQGFSVPRGQALPSLGLGRVFVLTSRATCSASESIINSLQGVGVQVVQIGSTTCGKPYGFYPQDNCGTTYFAIQFQGVNDQGFGDYADGFTPGGTGGASPPGCVVPEDDFAHALGDQAETRFAAALWYRAHDGSCPAAQLSARALVMQRTRAEGIAPKSPWLTNRITRR